MCRANSRAAAFVACKPPWPDSGLDGAFLSIMSPFGFIFGSWVPLDTESPSGPVPRGPRSTTGSSGSSVPRGGGQVESNCHCLKYSHLGSSMTPWWSSREWLTSFDCYHLNLLIIGIAWHIPSTIRCCIAKFLKPPRVVAVGCVAGTIFSANLDDANINHGLRSLSQHIIDMAYASSGMALAVLASVSFPSGVWHTRLFVIDPLTLLERSCVLPQLAHQATCVRYAPGGRYLAIGWDQGWLQIVQADFLRVVHTLQVQVEEVGDVSCIAYSPSGVDVVIGNTTGYLFFIDVWTYDVHRTVDAHVGDRSWTCLAFAPDGSKIAAGREGGEFYMISFPDGELIHKRSFHTLEAWAVDFHPSGVLIAFAPSGSLCTIDAGSGNVIRTLDLDGSNVSSLAFSPAGDRLAVACGSLRMYDESLALLSAVDLGAAALIVLCSPIK